MEEAIPNTIDQMHKQRSFAESFPERDARWGRNFPFRVGSAWQEEQFVIATRKLTIITKEFQNEDKIQMNRRLLSSSVPTNSMQRDSHLQISKSVMQSKRIC